MFPQEVEKIDIELLGEVIFSHITLIHICHVQSLSFYYKPVN